VVSSKRVSAIARPRRLVASCWRDASIARSRSSGCENDSDSPDRSVGLKLSRKLSLVLRELSHATE
jgi:hypothetical protein